MDELNEKLTRLLSSPDGMKKIQSAMAALGGMAEGASSAPSTAQTPMAAPPPSANAAGDEGGLPDLGALAKLAPLIGAFGGENDDTRLLQALRPYLHGEREQRLEDTMKFLRLAKLLPLLQEQGLFGSK